MCGFSEIPTNALLHVIILNARIHAGVNVYLIDGI